MSSICIENCRLFHPLELRGDYARHQVYEKDELAEFYPDLFWPWISPDDWIRHNNTTIPKERLYQDLKKIELEVFRTPDNRPKSLLQKVWDIWVGMLADKILCACQMDNAHHRSIPYAKFIDPYTSAKETVAVKDWGPLNQWCPECILSLPYHRFLWMLAQRIRPAKMLELGTFWGIGALHLVEGNPNGRLVCVDIHFPNREVLEVYPNITLIQGDSVKSAPIVAEHGPFDLVFIDTQHSYEQTKRELETYRPLLTDGAIVLFDDVYINHGMRRFWEELEDPKLFLPALNPKFMFGAKVF